MHADLTEAKKYTSQNEARGSRTKSLAHIVDLVKESLQRELSQPDPWVKISEKAADSFCVLNRIKNAINDLKVM